VLHGFWFSLIVSIISKGVNFCARDLMRKLSWAWSELINWICGFLHSTKAVCCSLFLHCTTKRKIFSIDELCQRGGNRKQPCFPPFCAYRKRWQSSTGRYNLKSDDLWLCTNTHVEMSRPNMMSIFCTQIQINSIQLPIL
jgi:hypothetical protein